MDLSAIDTQMKSEYEKRYSVKNNQMPQNTDIPCSHINLSIALKSEQIPAILTQRLKSELTKLRRMYEEETEKAKQEFMYLHSSKVMSLDSESRIKRLAIELNTLVISILTFQLYNKVIDYQLDWK